MNQKELKSLKKGDIVFHKKSGERYVVQSLCRAWDGLPPNMTREHMEACCEDSKGNWRYFEAKEIRMGDAK
jgi:hypothetical protein